jgi:protein SCO1/2
MPLGYAIRRLAVTWLLIALSLALFTGCEDDPDLPVLGEMPAFSFTDQDGRPFSGDDLDGRVVIATFLFTRCVTICPALSDRTARMSERLAAHGDAVHFVSFSVDPDHDTPERLRAHGERHGASFDRWTLVTGPVDGVNEVVVRGFKLAMGEPVPGPGESIEIMHSPRFVLVDREGRIRGYYESDEEGMASLERAVSSLL